MKAEDFTHLRYVDDLRVFVDSEEEAQAACNLLERLMRNRGLNLQSAKTELLRSKDAKKRLSRVQDTLKKISDELASELGIEAEYVSPEELRAEFSTDPNAPSPKVLLKAWRKLSDGKIRFDKSIFHYLIKRLGATGSDISYDFLFSILRSHPQETAYVLDYLNERRRLDSHDVAEQLCRFMRSNKVSRYQLYLILRCLVRCGAPIRDALLDAARYHLSRPGDALLTPWLVALIGQKGRTQNDVDAIDRVLSNSTDPLLRATCVWALRDHSKASIASIISRTKGESFWMDAAFLARSG